MTSLELSHDQLVPIMGFEMNYGRRTYQGYTAGQRGAIDQALNSGYRQFLFPEPMGGRGRHRWSFLWPESSLPLSKPQTSSTVTIDSGVVTIAAGTWPSWAAQGELTPTNGDTYAVASRDSDTQLTLDDTSVDEDALTGYSLGRAEYDMPSDFGGLQGDMTYRPGSNTGYDPIKFTSWNLVRRLRQLHAGSTMRPQKACLLAKAADPTAVQGWKIIFDYQSDDDHKLFYRYKVNIVALDATNKYAVGGPAHSETLLASCLYSAARFLNEDAQKIEQARQHFLTRLAASIDEDEALTPDFLGTMTDPSEDEGQLSRHNSSGVPVTYEGVEYF